MHMVSYSSVQNRQTIGNPLLMVLDGGEMQTIPADFDLQRQCEPQHDPEKPPPRQRGDRYYSLGALIGSIIGGVLSQFGGLLVFDIIAGVVIGGIVGLILGSLLRKHILNKKLKNKEF